MVDQDDLRLVEAFEPQRQEDRLDEECGEEQRVIAVDWPVGLPDEPGNDQEREHQAGEKAGPGLLKGKKDELGERRRKASERAPNPEAQRIE